MNVLFMEGPGELEEPVRVSFPEERTNLENFTISTPWSIPIPQLSIYHTGYFWELSLSWVLSVNGFTTVTMLPAWAEGLDSSALTSQCLHLHLLSITQ